MFDKKINSYLFHWHWNQKKCVVVTTKKNCLSQNRIINCIKLVQMLICLISGKYLSHWAVNFSWDFNIFSKYFTIIRLKSLALRRSNISTSFLIWREILSKFSWAMSCCRSRSVISWLKTWIFPTLWLNSALTLASLFFVRAIVILCLACQALTRSWNKILKIQKSNHRPSKQKVNISTRNKIIFIKI